MQQATVNLFADMGVQPFTIQAGLSTATPSSDVLAPSSSISSPVNGATVPRDMLIALSGTAADAGGGTVAAVELSVDGGATWRRAAGRENWTFSWIPQTAGSFTIRKVIANRPGLDKIHARAAFSNRTCGGAVTL